MTVRHKPFTRTPALAGALIAWSLLAVMTAAVDAPSWLGLPIAGTFSLCAVGLAVVLVAGMRDVPIAIAVTVSASLASLILGSELFLITDRLRPLATVALQAALVCALCAWAFQRYRAAGGDQTFEGETE
ncbi:MAG: hypothetical protein ACOYD0_06620 [Candidatus Nanopelagicales bacterium]